MPINQYIFTTTPGNISWSAAKTLAASLGGYLASVTSADENSIVLRALSLDTALWTAGPNGARNGPWIGYKQPAGSSEPGGGWVWDNGETSSFTFWHSGQPDNFVQDNRAIYFDLGFQVGWGDAPGTLPAAFGTIQSAVIEIGADVKALNGTDNHDFIYAGGIANTIHGKGGNDRIEGHLGGDLIFGDAGSDELYGQSGNDTLIGGNGLDSLRGGPGTDTVTYAQENSAVQVRLTGTPGRGAAFGDVLGSVEVLIGTSFNDTLEGNDGANTLHGGAGKDSLYGGNAGNDVLDGGAGDDILVAGTSTSFSNGTGNATMHGGAGADRLTGNFTVHGTASYQGDGAVRTSLNKSMDQTGAAQGDRYSFIDNLIGSEEGDWLAGSAAGNILEGMDGNDTLEGHAGDDTLKGGDGGDRIAGHSGDDKLSGGAGKDTLYGSEGIDVLNGGAGSDMLVGGEGNDFFFMSSPDSGPDTVRDFDSGTDKVQLLARNFGLSTTGALGSFLFRSLASGHAAITSLDAFTFDRSTHELWYDADRNGTKSAVLLFTLEGSNLVLDDIRLI